MGVRTQLAAFFRSPEAREQDRRKKDVEQGRAASPEEEISQREARRLSDMSGEDREWEQAALQRNHATQDRKMP